MIFSNSGIKQKVLLLALLPATTVTILLTIFTSINQIQGLDQSLNERGFAIIRQLSPASEYGVFSGNPEILRSLVDSVLNEPDVKAIKIRNASGKTLISSGPEIHIPEYQDTNPKAPTTYSSRNYQSQFFVAPIFQTEFSTDSLLEDIDSGNNKPATTITMTNRILGWVSVELSRERTQSFQKKTLFKTTLIAISILILSAILAVRLGRGISNPIMRLKKAVDEIENGNLDVNVGTTATEELQSLSAGINSMAKTLRLSRAEMEERVVSATSELRTALGALELRNIEIDAARREAESAIEAKSSFLANISHEIRTPLNGIQGFLNLLRKTKLENQQTDFIEKIDISTKTLLTLLNDILDFSKLEVSRISITNSEFNLRNLLDECISINVKDAHDKNLELISIVDAELPTLIFGDAGRIGQVIKNLVNNAIKFTTGGEIVLRAELADQSQNTVYFSVSDTGIGISHADQQHLFQPFSQLEAGMNRKTGGTGLGLAIVKSLVELMGGTVNVDSTPGKGSCFSFTLPLKYNQPKYNGDHSIRKIITDKHVLIISPDQLAIDSMRQILAHYGIKAATEENFNNSITVLRMIKEENSYFDVVIIDTIFQDNELDAIVNEIEHNQSRSSTHIIFLKRSDNQLLPSVYNNKILNIISYPPSTRCIIEKLSTLISGNNISNSQNEATGKSELVKIDNNSHFNVLVADDNSINRQFLSTWLNQVGASVDEVADGHDAVEHALRTHYDLILMDLHMPGLDGIEAANNIRINCYINTKTPIIAITADATNNAKQLVAKSSMNDYMIKPVHENELINTVAKWCPKLFAITTPPGNSYASKVENHLDSSSIVDRELGLRLASGNTHVWMNSLQTLISRLPSQLEQMNQAFETNNIQQVREIAHNIAGAAGYCGVTSLLSEIKQLEQQATDNDKAAVKSTLQKVEKEVKNLERWNQINN